MYAYDAGKKVVFNHYKRVWPNLKIDHIEDGASLGIYHTIFKLETHPLVSVIIPNKDHINDLDVAIKSLLEKTKYPNIEIIVVENNSKEKETWNYYKQIQDEFSNVKVVYYDGIFNYSKINNFGVKYAKGDFYLFMNNDVEMINENSIEEMVSYAIRDDVGVVGCRLLYSDNTIQHAGVIVGLQGIAEHAFKEKMYDKTYFNRALMVQDYSAVTAAVMLVKKSVFKSLKGFDEKFEVAFNDIDFCLRVRNKGKLIVYNPYACFYHYESKSRGNENTPKKMKRFNREIGMFIKKYEKLLVDGDPFYNPNLTLGHTGGYWLRDFDIEEIGKPLWDKKTFDRYKQTINKL